EDDMNENDILKRIISTHPSYSLLLQSHINCLQVLSLSLISLSLSLRERKQI
ncbi:MAG: hypothetical protein EOO01_41985, partial [Chitinophagaceae bacterium]